MRTLLRAMTGLMLWLGGVAAAQTTKPNFIFLLTDDQRWDALSCVQKEMGDKGRFPWIRTPNMDRIANEGVRFRNAFVIDSLCAPSRACFLTGRYNHCNGVINNRTAFPLNNITHASELRKEGYVTGYFGKWHQDGQEERPGFDHYASFIGQGVFHDCPLLVDGKKTPTQGWVDDVTTEHAIQFIRDNKARPFDMVLGFKSPHDPRTPPPRTKDLYANDVARPVPNLNTPAIYGGGKGGANAENIRNYFRCIKAVDDNIGKILAVLEELKIDQHTVVIFAGDNGYYFGEHGLGDKRSAYDESLRIPLVIRYPQKISKGKLVDEMVLNLDLAPTILDLAGAKVPAEMQGRSWKPLLEGKPTEWRHAFFYEYFREGNFAAPTVLGVRTETAKLLKYPGHDEWTELFDLKNDPFEMKNLIQDPAHAELLKQMQAEYDRQAQAVQFQMLGGDTPTKNGDKKKDKAKRATP